jgi:hypothetical protein
MTIYGNDDDGGDGGHGREQHCTGTCALPLSLISAQMNLAGRFRLGARVETVAELDQVHEVPVQTAQSRQVARQELPLTPPPAAERPFQSPHHDWQRQCIIRDGTGMASHQKRARIGASRLISPPC